MFKVLLKRYNEQMQRLGLDGRRDVLGADSLADIFEIDVTFDIAFPYTHFRVTYVREDLAILAKCEAVTFDDASERQFLKLDKTARGNYSYFTPTGEKICKDALENLCDLLAVPREEGYQEVEALYPGHVEILPALLKFLPNPQAKEVLNNDHDVENKRFHI